MKSELKTGDERFVKDQRKQGEDVALLVERIDNQIAIMRRAYRRELILIEVAITFVLFKTVFSIFIASFIKKQKVQYNLCKLTFNYFKIVLFTENTVR